MLSLVALCSVSGCKLAASVSFLAAKVIWAVVFVVAADRVAAGLSWRQALASDRNRNTDERENGPQSLNSNELGRQLCRSSSFRPCARRLEAGASLGAVARPAAARSCLQSVGRPASCSTAAGGKKPCATPTGRHSVHGDARCIVRPYLWRRIFIAGRGAHRVSPPPTALEERYSHLRR